MLRFYALLIAALAGSAAHAASHWVSKPLVIGESFTTNAVGAERAVHVVLPKGYAEDDAKSYPVIVMLDAGIEQDFYLTLGLERWNQLWGRSEAAIFVGVQTVDRYGELLSSHGTAEEARRYPTAGRAAAFRGWLVDTVLPLIRTRYRTDGRFFLMGESAAGHFVAETWVVSPSAFEGYAAISPSLHWDNQKLARELAASDFQARPPLFISLADEGGETEKGMFRFLGASGKNICFADRRGNLHHANSLHGLLPEALQFLLPTDATWLAEYGLELRCSADFGAAP